MSKNKLRMVDFFIEQILKRKGILSESEIKEIIRNFEQTFSDQNYVRDGKHYWGNYSRVIVSKWKDSGEHPEELKNLLLSVKYGEDDIRSGPPDSGLHIKSKDEKDFTERFVVPSLESEGHEITECNTNRRDEFNIDIVSVKDGVIYYTEVKYNLGGHHLQTAIGQLLLKEFKDKNDSAEGRYQIAFPEQYRGNRHFSNNFEQFLHDKLKIDIIFIKG